MNEDIGMRREFEEWIGNPHMLLRNIEPGFKDEYDNPWTNGAWTSWKYLYNKD